MNIKSNDNFKYYYVDGKLEVIYAEAEVNPREEAKGSIVFVHGVCHGAWCWENFLHYFSERGYHCFAFSLRGHGKSKGHLLKLIYNLSNYVEDTKTIVQHCFEKTKQKPVLIGHSMGGAVVQKYIGEYANTVKAAVLFAPATAGGMGHWQLFIDSFTNKPLTLASLTALFNIKFQIEKSAFFDNQIDPIEVEKYKKLLQNESLVIIWQLGAPYTDKYDVNIPKFVIGSRTDIYFPYDSLKKTAEMYHLDVGNKNEFFALENMCHDMMLHRNFEQSAEPILHFIKSLT